MWWKYLSVFLLLYTLVAGLRVPLKSGIERAAPAVVKPGIPQEITLYGYNTRFTEPLDGGQVNVWLNYDDPDSRHDSMAIAADKITIVNDTVMTVSLQLPAQSPKGENQYSVNLTVDHPVVGASLLPAALRVDGPAPDSLGSGGHKNWSGSLVSGVHVQKGFSFPYQNILYETIRNLYYHVPMWFVLMFLFIASVWNSLLFLFQPNIAESLERPQPAWRARVLRWMQHPAIDLDRKAAGYAEMGLFFGFLGLVTGMLWATYTWGKPWSNDIKQLMTAVALLIYLAYFILRSSFDEPEKGARLAAVYNIFAFASLVPLLYILPRMFASLHPGATGNPAFGGQDLDNTMRLVFYPAIIGWTLLGFWIAQLRIRYQRLHDKAAGLD